MARIFDHIAPGYDLMNLVLSWGVIVYWDYRFRRALPRHFQGVCLDMGCGTAAFWRGLGRRWARARYFGLDLSWPMLRKGRDKLPPSGRARTALVQGSALELPLAGESVGMVVSQFALRNMRPRGQALQEALRVLKPGGTMYLLEFGPGRQRIWGGLYNFYLEQALPRLAGLFSPLPGAYDYLVRSILDFPEPECIGQELEEAGFEAVAYKALSSGIVYLFTAQKPGRA